MPLRNQDKYNIVVKGEPSEVTEIRKKLLTEFDGLEFIDEGHKYFLNGRELMSVSNFAGQFESEFDVEQKAIDYAKKNGETPEYWKDKWKFTNLKATVTGTQVHEYSEALAWMHMGVPENMPENQKYKYIKDKDWLIPTRPKEEASLEFWKNFPKNTYVVLPETRIYNIGDTYAYAGTFDLLVYYKHPTNDSKSGLILLDWKTNSDIYKEFSRSKFKMLAYPFDRLFDEPFGGYSIQLNAYAKALEKIGLRVIGRRIVWLKEDKTFEIVPIDDLTTEFNTLDPKLLTK